ncbi:unnamed protein product [Thelazia callipaeda]|uniref:UBA domain-containing protein n=1 Tax=Thelazia callipaeda TaxID=103827 RepID=A0A0N5D2K8_THECL|nr:unnamed protein product [Thelazia callipaeda]
MFPPHRPALASTSSPAQISTSTTSSAPSNVAGISLRTPEPSPRIRKDATTDVRVGVGRHRDKLEQIRDSLRPFEQSNNTELSATTSLAAATSSNNNNFTIEDETRRQILINTLTQIGFEEQAALLALELVRYSSVAAAAEVLLNLNKEHVFRQDLHDYGGTLQGTATSSASFLYSSNNSNSINTVMYNNTKLSMVPSSQLNNGQTSGALAVSNVMVNAQLTTASILTNVDDSSSSRSNSPLTRIPSPSTAPSSFQVSSTSPSFQIKNNTYQQTADYHRTLTHLSVDSSKFCYNNSIKTAVNNFDYALPTPPSQSSPAIATGSSLSALARSRKVDRPTTQQASAIITIEGLQGCTGDRITKSKQSLVSRSYINGSNVGLRRPDTIPVIRTRLEKPINAIILNAPESLYVMV